MARCFKPIGLHAEIWGLAQLIVGPIDLNKLDKVLLVLTFHRQEVDVVYVEVRVQFEVRLFAIFFPIIHNLIPFQYF